MKDIIIALGYTPIESKNPYMVSYKKDDKRVNHYFTTDTVTIQDGSGLNKTYARVTPDDIETLLQ